VDDWIDPAPLAQARELLRRTEPLAAAGR